MVYSIVCVPSQKFLQLMLFESSAACSEYHNIVVFQWPNAMIIRKNSLSEALKVVQSFSINLKE